MMKTIATIVLFTFTTRGYCQIDTVVDNRHYNHVVFHERGQVLVLGNYDDTVKTGEWRYFLEGGQLLGYGKYKSDKKIGKWIYFDKGTKNKIRWSSKYPPNEWIKKDEEGRLAIYDFVNVNKKVPFIYYYKNGTRKRATF